ncbi:MAG: FAD-dependent thymidylate synthase [Bryobacterales bacterium]|nr:FAD-dependent thymidylate synthase [Bryobacterales bacterium]MBV9399354.1 FAD-dependent thymidylate synthase [Bryobacterales bacterium]
MPPEKTAYALARYSRSPDPIGDSIEWVRTHDSAKFLESFYFQYGHASIADLGHVVMCFEHVSELAATEIEDEQLWDGQARSSRYQDFSRSGFITPPELTGEHAANYEAAGEKLLAAYHRIHAGMCEFLSEKLPRPEDMKIDAYRRNIAARAFDVARYTLFFGIPTGVGQVTSIRTLERQAGRLKASEYAEIRELGDEIAAACAAPPGSALDPALANEPVAPTLARHVDADAQLMKSPNDLRCWAAQNLPAPAGGVSGMIDLLRPEEQHAEIAATLLYPVTDRPFRELYDIARGWTAARRNEVIDLAVGLQKRRGELSRAFRSGPYVFDIVMDIGAYRDLHRHRRCQQFRQVYSGRLGYDTPEILAEAGLENTYTSAMADAFETLGSLPQPGAHYLLPFGARSRFLFKMDFAEAEYISRLRSGVKGHFSYRKIAWEMKRKMEELEPELGRLMEATPPWVEDPLQR